MKSLFKSVCFRLVILSILLFFVLPSYAQMDDIKIKTVNHIRCGNSEYVIINKKQKQGIYNSETKKFVIKPRPSFFYYFDLLDVLFEIQESSQIVIYNLGNEDNPLAPIQLENCSTQLILQGNSYYPNFGNTLLREGKLFRMGGFANWQNTASSELSNDLTNNIISDAHFLFGIDVKNHFATIHNYHECHLYEPIHPLKSVIQMEGVVGDERKDSIDEAGYTVYSMRRPGLAQTGVYNLKHKVWDVEPIYTRIHNYGNYYFAMREVSESKNPCYSDGQKYDIYTIKDDRIVQVDHQNIWTNGGFNSCLLFPALRVWRDKDSTYVFVQTDSGLGLYRAQLFDTYWSNYGYAPLEAMANFYVDTLFNPIYKAIIKTGRDNSLFLTFDGNYFEASRMISNDLIKIPQRFTKEYYQFSPGSYHYLNDYLIDGLYYSDTARYANFIELRFNKNSPPKKHTAKYGMSVLNDSLIYVHCFIPENWDDLDPIYGIVYPGEDSLNANGQQLYYPPDPGIYESGIYNYKQNTWHIPNEYAWIQVSQDGYLLCNPVLNKDNYFLEYRYSFRDLNNQIVFENATIYTLPDLGIALNEFGLE